MKIKPGVKEPSKLNTIYRAIKKQCKYNQLEPHMIQKLILQQTPQDLVEAAKLNQPLENNAIEVLEKLYQDLNHQYRIRILALQNINPDAQAKACDYIHLLNSMITEVQTVINNKRNKILNAANTNVYAQWAEQQLVDFTAAYESKNGTNEVRLGM
jgi:flagellar motor switch protein FliG